jgi:hypothetical protein
MSAHNGEVGLSRYRTFFLVAAWYDLVLGAMFFFLYRTVFYVFAIPVPSDPSYLHLAAAFVFVQGLGYWYVSRNLMRNVDLVKVGLIYKLAYVGVAAYYFFRGELPHVMFGWFAIFDALFAVGFARFLMVARWRGHVGSPAAGPV